MFYTLRKPPLKIFSVTEEVTELMWERQCCIIKEHGT